MKAFLGFTLALLVLAGSTVRASDVLTRASKVPVNTVQVDLARICSMLGGTWQNDPQANGNGTCTVNMNDPARQQALSEACASLGGTWDLQAMTCQVQAQVSIPPGPNLCAMLGGTWDSTANNGQGKCQLCR